MVNGNPISAIKIKNVRRSLAEVRCIAIIWASISGHYVSKETNFLRYRRRNKPAVLLLTQTSIRGTAETVEGMHDLAAHDREAFELGATEPGRRRHHRGSGGAGKRAVGDYGNIL